MKRPWSKGRPRGTRRRPGLIERAVAAALFVAVALVAAGYAAISGDAVEGSATAADGDSLRIGERRIRLEGLDAPELAQTCRSATREEPCGRQSRDHLRDLIAGARVECSGWRVDRYGRLLARCRVRGVDLNRQMVRDGWAMSYGSYGAEESDARADRRGLWAGEFERPREWRRRNADGAREDSDPAASVAATLGRALERMLAGN